MKKQNRNFQRYILGLNMELLVLRISGMKLSLMKKRRLEIKFFIEKLLLQKEQL